MGDCGVDMQWSCFDGSVPVSIIISLILIYTEESSVVYFLKAP